MVEVASDVGDVAVGDSVAIEPVYRCGACPACRRGATNLCEQLGFYGLMGGGGMSEYAVMPSYMIHQLPSELSREQGALVEPIAVGLRAVRRAGLVAGQTAAVFGAGPIGAVTMQCLKALGAGQIIAVELSETRKRKALELGADVVIDPSEEDAVARIRELTGGEGVEHSFDAGGLRGHPAHRAGRDAQGRDRTIISIWEGPVSINPNDIVLAELNVLGTICYTPEDFADTIGMIRDGSIVTDGMITERIALDDVVGGGFDRAGLAQGPAREDPGPLLGLGLGRRESSLRVVRVPEGEQPGAVAEVVHGVLRRRGRARGSSDRRRPAGARPSRGRPSPGRRPRRAGRSARRGAGRRWHPARGR